MTVETLAKKLNKNFELVSCRTFVSDLNNKIKDICINNGTIINNVIKTDIDYDWAKEKVVCYAVEDNAITIWVKSYWYKDKAEQSIPNALAIKYLKEVGMNVNSV